MDYFYTKLYGIFGRDVHNVELNIARTYTQDRTDDMFPFLCILDSDGPQSGKILIRMPVTCRPS